MSEYFYPSKNVGKGHMMQKDGGLNQWSLGFKSQKPTDTHAKMGGFIKKYKASLRNWTGRKTPPL